MVKATDALWDARGGKRGDKGAVMPTPKVAPLPAQTYIPFKTLAMVCVNFTSTTPTRLTGVLRPVLAGKTSLPLSHLRFGGQSHTRHCHGYAFPCRFRIDFSHR
jgi:hypothetical protein